MIGQRQRGNLPRLAALAVAGVMALCLGACQAVSERGPLPQPVSLLAPAKTGTTGGKTGPAATDTAASSDSADTVAKYECFLLPTDWRNADGTINEAAIVTQEKKRLDFFNKELKVTFRMSETTHYLLFSCAPEKETQLFNTWCENLYSNLCRQFEIGATDHLWDGKCLIMLFDTKERFKDYAEKYDHCSTHIEKAAGYFLWECREVPGTDSKTLPQLVHICIPVGDKPIPQMLQSVFAHEATHAFFEMYRKPGRLPLWLHEGVAVYMQVVNEPLMRGGQLKLAKDYIAANKSLKPMFDNTLDDLTEEQYGVAYSLVETLIGQGGGKFKQFVIKLKDGEKVDAAMKAAYGFDTAGLEKQWRDALAKIKLTAKKA